MIHVVSADGKIRFIKTEPGVHRKRRWTLTVSWDSLDGHHKKIIQPKKKCYLADVETLLPSGNLVWNVKWEAKGK